MRQLPGKSFVPHKFSLIHNSVKGPKVELADAAQVLGADLSQPQFADSMRLFLPGQAFELFALLAPTHLVEQGRSGSLQTFFGSAKQDRGS